MERLLPRQLDVPVELAALLMEAAVEAARHNAKNILRSRRPRRGLTLHPGPDTPLWNVLARAIESQLVRRGEKARLARVLGLPRQRVHDFLRARRHLPDAERTLLLLAWLHARRSGSDLN